MAEPIVGINRNRVSPYTFLGRYQQKQKEDADTNIAVRQNQLALANVNNSLIRITDHIGTLSSGLQGISAQIKESSAIENLKEQQKQRQEKQLAENEIREGKENVVERRIQQALITPVRKIGAKAQGTLFNLTRFFNILLGGFLLNRILLSVSQLSEDGKLTLKNLGDKIAKDLAVVGAIFLGINGGFSLALSTIARLAGLITRIAVNGLLLAPIRLVFGVAGRALRSLSNKIRNIPRVTIPPRTGGGTGSGGGTGRTGGGTGRTGGGGGTNSSASGRLTNLIGGRNILGSILKSAGGTAILNFLFGAPVGQSAARGLGASVLPLMLKLSGPTGFLAGIAGMYLGGELYNQFGGQIEESLPGLKYTIDDLFGSLTSVAGGNKSLVAKDQGPDVSTINIEAGGSSSTMEVDAVSGPANYLPKVSSSNPSNFYLMYSKIKYNVVG